MEQNSNWWTPFVGSTIFALCQLESPFAEGSLVCQEDGLVLLAASGPVSSPWQEIRQMDLVSSHRRRGVAALRIWTGRNYDLRTFTAPKPNIDEVTAADALVTSFVSPAKDPEKADPALIINVVSGAGWAPQSGASCGLFLENDSFALGDPASSSQKSIESRIRVPLIDIVSVVAEPRDRRSGGGFFGGGFGVQGAAEGMLLSAVLNRLTTNHEHWVEIGIRGKTGWLEGVVITDSPFAVQRIRKLLRPLFDAAVTNNRALQPPASGSSSIADELAKLVELKERGVLSDEEFNTVKKRLINSSD